MCARCGVLFRYHATTYHVFFFSHSVICTDGSATEGCRSIQIRSRNRRDERVSRYSRSINVSSFCMRRQASRSCFAFLDEKKKRQRILFGDQNHLILGLSNVFARATWWLEQSASLHRLPVNWTKEARCRLIRTPQREIQPLNPHFHRWGRFRSMSFFDGTLTIPGGGSPGPKRRKKEKKTSRQSATFLQKYSLPLGP